MIFARFVCVPAKDHPDHDRVGESFINCWLRVRSFSEAKILAEQNFADTSWQIQQLDEMWRIPKGHFQTVDDGLPYYEQALVDREVYVIHTYPKYPVYCVDFLAMPTTENSEYCLSRTAKGKYWVVNEKVAELPDDPLDFAWSGVNVEHAITLARNCVQSSNWQIKEITNTAPVNHEVYKNNSLLSQYYEEAEEYGECVAFWVDN